MRIKNILFLFTILNSLFTIGQDLGKHDPKIKWRSLETDNVRVIFSRETEGNAKRIADVIEYIHNNKTFSIGAKSKKIDIILQNQQSISNGFVTLSPYRSEFFAITPQNQAILGSTDWLDLLSIHEYRHALQYANANRGLTKFFHIISGENGWAVFQNLSIPSWHLEGDAVLNETLLTENGRGRNPYFFKEQRALFLEDNIYSYHKAQNGSFKDIVPNIYPLGFMMNNHIRNNYGIETGKNIIKDAGSYKYILYPFSSAMKKHTGLTTTKMYKESAVALQKYWQQKANNLNLTKKTLVTREHANTVTDYTFPHYTNDGTIIAIKKSFKETPSIVIIENGEEKKETSIGIAAQEFLSVTNHLMTWTEHQKDLRHENVNYSDIYIYNRNTKKKQKLTKRKRYFSPEISYDGKKVIAVNYKENISYSIDVLDINTGSVLQKLPNTKNYFLSTPKWTRDNQSIVYVAKFNSKLAFFKYDTNTSKTKQISEWTNNTIGQFSLGVNTIYFSASYSGIDNIYSIDLDGNNNLKQISSVLVGAAFPNISEDETKIIFSEFSSKGYQLYEQKIETTETDDTNYAHPNLKQTNYYSIKTTAIEHAILDSIPSNNYKTSEYSGTLKGTKLHSWGFTTSSTSTSTYGASLQFQNILDDFRADVNFLYNPNENASNWSTNISYGKNLLSWNLKAATQDRSAYATISRFPGVSVFSETSYGLGISIPLSQYKGNYIRSFNFESSFIQRELSDYFFQGLDFPVASNFGAIESSITLSNIRRRALQNVAPRFGQYLQVNYFKSANSQTAEKISLNSIFYFPGFFKNHSLNIVANWQKELMRNSYQYSDTFSYARGYTPYYNDAVQKLSINYELPVLYPDFGLWGLTYFKRIRLNLFYDASRLESYNYDFSGSLQNFFLNIEPISIDQNSYGAELIFDNIYLNIAPISVGLRFSYLTDIDLFAVPNTNSDFEIFFRIGF